MQDINSIISILKAEIDEYIYSNNNQAITGLILNSVLNDIVENLGEYVDYKSLEVLTTDEEGLYFTDANGYVIMSITQDGLNVALFENGLIDYINSIVEIPTYQKEIFTTTEDGFFVTDTNGNVLASFTQDGFDTALITQHLIDYLSSLLTDTKTEWEKVNNTLYIINIE